MSENKTNGQIQIADEVVGVIATTAALEVEGVVAGGGKVPLLSPVSEYYLN